MRLIGLNGRLHSGKDTAFDYIEDAAGRANVKREGFADRMKLSGLWALGFEPQSADDALEIANALKDNGRIQTFFNTHEKVPQMRVLTGRKFWQLYGTESHRNVFGTDFWVDVLLPQAHEAPEHWQRREHNERALQRQFPDVDVLVITDVRFENEADRILRLGGEIWYIDAEERLGPLPPDAHPSEHPLPEHLITVTVPNNTTLEQFQIACRMTFEIGVKR